MTVQKHEWEQMSAAELRDRPGRWLWVEDGTCGYAIPFGDRDSVKALLDDYASGYIAGYIGEEIIVGWVLAKDGFEEDRGRHQFLASND